MPPPQTPRYTGTIPEEHELNRMLENVKKDVFMRTDAAFLGSLLCSHEFHWDFDESITDTACTDGLNIWWSVYDFMRCSPGERRSTLLHELWHTGFLYFLRQGSRCPDVWNMAADIRINNNLIYDGQEVPKNGWWVFDPAFDKKGIMPEEDIYDILMKNPHMKPQNFKMDVRPPKDGNSAQTNAKVLSAVIRAVQAAEMSNQAGHLPGNLKELLNKFLEPKINWRQVLYEWMTELLDEDDYTWERPNRRYQSHGLYLPSIEEPEGRLEHLVFIEDVSGSISKKDHIRFNSEVKYVKEVLKPRKLTLLQFDTRIAYEKVFEEDEPFERIEIHGGGGTSLVPVRKWIEKNQPTAAIIFSDLWCDPMKPLTNAIPIIWATVNNLGATVPFGTLIHITED